MKTLPKLPKSPDAPWGAAAQGYLCQGFREALAMAQDHPEQFAKLVAMPLNNVQLRRLIWGFFSSHPAVSDSEEDVN